MKMLFGFYQPDEGSILLRGEHTEIADPKVALRAGIGMVHQHFMLAGPLSVLDNIIVGDERSSLFHGIQRPQLKTQIQSIMKPLGLNIDLDVPVATLPVGVQQKIEIIKLLYRNCQVLILDEPTAVLTPQEITEFFEQLRRLKAQGKTILIITHKLKEIMQITDMVTVMRQGRALQTVPTLKTNPQKLAHLMIGSELKKNITPDIKLLPTACVDVQGLHCEGKVEGVSFQIRSGEVVGFAGVEGNGQMELLRAICYPQTCQPKLLQGHVKVLGTTSLSHEGAHVKTSQLRNMGVGIFPEDRLRFGVVGNMSAAENFVLGYQRSSLFSKRGWLKETTLKNHYVTASEAFDIRPRNPDLQVKRFSGGNQQKIVVAREVRAEPQLIVAIHPTRGVDIGAIQIIYGELLKAKARGAGVLLISSELDELLELADRLYVLYQGKIVAEFAKSEFNEQKIGIAMGGGHD